MQNIILLLGCCLLNFLKASARKIYILKPRQEMGQSFEESLGNLVKKLEIF